MIDRYLKLFESLNKNNVEYLLIGGALSIAYGVPRLTKDIDIFLNPAIKNATALLKALEEFGMGTASLTTPEEICKTEITIFKDIVRFDVLTQVKGLNFADAWQKKVFLSLHNIMIPAINIDDLISSKQAAGRPHDKEDIKILKMAKAKK
jgi:predicted nucleotidyltransferase